MTCRFFKLPHEQVAVSDSMASHAIFDPGTVAQLLQTFDEICETHTGEGENYLTFGLYSQLQYTAGMLIYDDDNDFDKGLRELEEAGEEDQSVVDRVVFGNIQRALREPSRTIEWDQLANALPIEGDDLDGLVAAYNKLDDWLVEEDHLVVNIPSDDPRDFLACYPNGFFHGDLDVYQNAAVIGYMTVTHRARFLGMGSCTLVFRTPSNLTDSAVDAITEDMLYFYGLTDFPQRDVLRSSVIDKGLIVLFNTVDVF